MLLNVLTKGAEHRRTIYTAGYVNLRMQTRVVIECMHTAICSWMTGSLPRSLIIDETHKLPRANSNVVKRKCECCRGRFRHFRPIRVKALLPVKRISSNIYHWRANSNKNVTWLANNKISASFRPRNFCVRKQFNSYLVRLHCIFGCGNGVLNKVYIALKIKRIKNIIHNAQKY